MLKKLAWAALGAITTVLGIGVLVAGAALAAVFILAVLGFVIGCVVVYALCDWYQNRQARKQGSKG